MSLLSTAARTVADWVRLGFPEEVAKRMAAGGVATAAATQSDDAEAGFVTRGGKTLLEAFHGSPHKFDKFSMDQIGTGEGAQAYGHGLYFADSEDVAREYRDRLSVGIDGNDSLTYKIGDSEYVRGDPEWKAVATIQNDGLKRAEELRQIYSNDLAAGKPYIDTETVKRYSDALDRLRSGEEWSESTGALYRTEIDVTPESLLDWDAMLDEQPKAVQEAIESSDWWDYAADDLWSREDNPTGGDLVRWLSDDGPEFGSQQLNDRGIKGIKYLDGDSRAAGDGTSNYVIFDDSLINIAERGSADPRLLAGIAAGGAGATAAPSLLQMADEYSGKVIDALEMPYRGLLGLGRLGGGLLAGEGLDASIDSAVRQIKQPIDKTADEVGDSLLKATGSPEAATLANLLVQFHPSALF